MKYLVTVPVGVICKVLCVPFRGTRTGLETRRRYVTRLRRTCLDRGSSRSDDPGLVTDALRMTLGRHVHVVCGTRCGGQGCVTPLVMLRVDDVRATEVRRLFWCRRISRQLLYFTSLFLAREMWAGQ